MADTLTRLDYTHFVCVPLRGAESSIATFQTDLLGRFGPKSASPSAGLDESIMVSPSQLHVTLLRLRLYTPAALRAAVRALRSVSEQVRGALKSQSVRLQGLGAGGPSAGGGTEPADSHTLYFKVSDASPRTPSASSLSSSPAAGVGEVPVPASAAASAS